MSLKIPASQQLLLELVMCFIPVCGLRHLLHSYIVSLPKAAGSRLTRKKTERKTLAGGILGDFLASLFELLLV